MLSEQFGTVRQLTVAGPASIAKLTSSDKAIREVDAIGSREEP